MFGPQGALPLTTTEEAYNWLRERDDAFPRFVDIFQRRFLALFFRAWADAHPVTQNDRPDEDRFRVYIGSMIGIGAPAYRNADFDPGLRQAPICGTARAAGQERLSPALVPVELLEDARRDRGVRRRLACVRPERTHEVSARRTAASASTASPERACTASATSFASASMSATSNISGGFCRVRRSRAEIADAIFLYVGEEYDWDMELAIPAGEITPVRLGESVQLGWTSWMAPNWAKTDETIRTDARFHVVSRIASSVGATRRIRQGKHHGRRHQRRGGRRQTQQGRLRGLHHGACGRPRPQETAISNSAIGSSSFCRRTGPTSP